jgi:hypothetical protein
VVAELAATVERLSVQVDQAGAGGLQAVGPAGRELGGSELAEWVAWLTERYELGIALPECWPLHGALVEELAALHTGWVAANRTGDRAAWAQWHDLFARALDRFEGRWRTCIDGTHRPSVAPAWLETGPGRRRGDRPAQRSCSGTGLSAARVGDR